MQKGDMVLVRWQDTNGSETWKSAAAFETIQPACILTVGVYYGEDEHCVRVAHDVADDGDVIGTVVPKGCVVEILPLEIKP